MFIGISFLELVVLNVFEGETLNHHLLAIYDNTLVKRLGGDTVLHSTHDLEFVIIDRANVSYCCCGPSLVFILIFFDESLDNFVKAKEIGILKMHFMV